MKMKVRDTECGLKEEHAQDRRILMRRFRTLTCHHSRSTEKKNKNNSDGIRLKDSTDFALWLRNMANVSCNNRDENGAMGNGVSLLEQRRNQVEPIVMVMRRSVKRRDETEK